MSGDADAVLDIRDLTFGYGDKTVLKNFSLRAGRKERLAILGTSGCGKSTLLRLILGLIRPEAGSIRFENRDIAKLSGKELNAARRRIGMVYQGAALISSINVEENLALPLTELTDKPPDEVGKIVDEKLELVGMKETKAKLPAELSGGMRKRIGIARALVMEPELVLFDEPAAGLDPVATALIDDLIVRLSERSTTCIVVTHNLASAFRIATRMAMLYDGAILEQGVPDAFRRSENPIVRQFIDGDPDGPLSPKAQG